jgi:hypothetical protein
MLRALLCGIGIAVAGIALVVARDGETTARQALESLSPDSLRPVLSHDAPAPTAPAGNLQPAQTPAGPASPHAELVKKYCATCHNERLATAGLKLDALDVRNVAQNAQAWEKVVAKLRAGQMPPVGRPRPEAATLEAFVSHLETELDRSAASAPNPGRPILRRLNRTEYANAVRDLLSVEIDPEALLPIDELQYGFDNIGAALSVTPPLLERYVTVAHQISGLAVGEEAAPSSETYKVDPFLVQEERMSEDLPFGSRGGIAIRHHFPVDGEYTVKVILQRNSRSYVRGLFEPHQLDIRVDGQRVQLFTVGGGEKMAIPGPPFVRASALGDQKSELYQISEVDKNLEASFFAKAGRRTIAVTFLHENLIPEYPIFRPRIGTEIDRVQWRGGNPAIHEVEIRGPHRVAGKGETASRRRIFVCQPAGPAEEKPCAARILSELAGRAYRRPVTEDDVRALLEVYETVRQDGGFEAGIRSAVTRILVGPEFLFRIERQPAGAAPIHRVSDLELASRLSFFLWSSIPDEELLNEAVKGRLHDREVLERQVRRMFADPRSARALTANFASQWLHLRNISASTPDKELFPDFDENLRQAFRQETELFVESLLREDRSILRLLDADYTFLNERLARHYGIPNVYGSHFRRVTLGPEFDMRRGLLGKGGLLTVTSYGNRTSVVLRGHWVLKNLLSAPPPPPPPNIPPLENAGAIGELPLRQLLEKHRSRPACKVCHAPMDPLGFALENFDAIGQWRTTDAGVPIDASGVLPDGTAFEGPAGLRSVLLRSPERFASTVAERLLTYALGRGVEYYDAPAVRAIVREAARNDYRWSSFVLATARSVPFQMRKADQAATTEEP